MCDDFTTSSDDQNLSRRGLTRREFTALTASAALAGCASSLEGGVSPSDELTEGMVEVATEDGVADAFFVHPGSGQHPGVILWPDIAGLRESKKIMARSLAAEGYAVLAVNQYYRSAKSPILETFAEWRTPEGREKIGPARKALDTDAITRDARAFVGFLDGQDAVDTGRRIGTNGYCMGGPFTVRTAAAVPSRVGAAASFHGGRLATDAADSPHRLIKTTEASFLFAVAQNDDAKDPEAKEALRAAADEAGRSAEIEVYAADHGWCVPDSPSWNAAEAERAWQRMLALYAGL